MNNTKHRIVTMHVPRHCSQVLKFSLNYITQFRSYLSFAEVTLIISPHCKMTPKVTELVQEMVVRANP